jgi:hypothetical protein
LDWILSLKKRIYKTEKIVNETNKSLKETFEIINELAKYISDKRQKDEKI